MSDWGSYASKCDEAGSDSEIKGDLASASGDIS
jgi:hypothetical protein